MDVNLDGQWRKRRRKKTEEEKKKIRAGIEKYRSFMKSEKRFRGIQPLCRTCKKRCKVLNGKDSTFECRAYEKSKRRQK